MFRTCAESYSSMKNMPWHIVYEQTHRVNTMPSDGHVGKLLFFPTNGSLGHCSGSSLLNEG